MQRQTMRVLHITPTYFHAESIVGGGERFPLELARAMGKYVETTVVSFGVEPKTITLSDKVQLKVYRRWNQANPINPRNPVFLKDLWNADVIHCHQYFTIPTNVAVIAGKLLAKKVFATDLGGAGWNVAFHVNLTRWLDGYLLCSQNSASLAPDCLAPIQIIYAGCDTELYRPTRPKERKVMFVGRFIAIKGIEVLIEAMPPDVPLHIIGTPYDERYYQDLKGLASGKNVSFCTGLSDQEIVDEYSSAVACVLPAVSRTMYGDVCQNAQLFALPLVEAMACETVPIATDLFAHPEIIEDGVTGFLVPPNDPAALRARIEHVLGHEAEAREMGRRGRAVVKDRFSWDAVAKRCLQAYGHAV